MLGIPVGLAVFGAGEWATAQVPLARPRPRQDESIRVSLSRSSSSGAQARWLRPSVRRSGVEHADAGARSDRTRRDRARCTRRCFRSRRSTRQRSGTACDALPPGPSPRASRSEVGRDHLTWHYEHHMGDQDRNFGVVWAWFDLIAGTPRAVRRHRQRAARPREGRGARRDREEQAPHCAPNAEARCADSYAGSLPLAEPLEEGVRSRGDQAFDRARARRGMSQERATFGRWERRGRGRAIRTDASRHAGRSSGTRRDARVARRLARRPREGDRAAPDLSQVLGDVVRAVPRANAAPRGDVSRSRRQVGRLRRRCRDQRSDRERPAVCREQASHRAGRDRSRRQRLGAVRSQRNSATRADR